MTKVRSLAPVVSLLIVTACSQNPDAAKRADQNKVGDSSGINEPRSNPGQANAAAAVPPKLTVEPTEFRPGDEINLHGEFAMGLRLRPIACHDISKPEDQSTSPQHYTVRLLRLDASGNESNPFPNSFSTIEWDSATANTWVKRDFAPLVIPRDAGDRIRVALEYGRDNLVFTGGNCHIETTYDHLATHDYRLSCNRDSPRCRYIRDD